MGKIILNIALCQMLPLGMLSFFLEKRGKRLIASIIFGVVASLTAFYVNSNFIRVLGVSTVYYNTTFAPMVEEVLKFIPVLLSILIYRKGFRGTVANSFCVGVGFCIVENYFYLIENLDNAGILWVILRCISTGLMHSMSAVIHGIGIFCALRYKKATVLSIISSLFTVFIYHGIYNLLVNSSLFVIVGVSIPMVTFFIVFYFVKSEKYKHIIGISEES